MTAFSSWGTGRRAAAALGAVSLGLVTLSACEKPTPLATVTAGKDTVTAEAACYDDGKVLGDLAASDKKAQAEFTKCLTTEPKKTLTVHPGEKLRLGVEPDVAEDGWIALSNNSPITNVSKQTYQVVASADQLFVNQQTRSLADSTVVSVVATKGGKYTGVWNVKLKRAES
ncbi:lipoprotein [Streptomyces chrestomyceticus JCM 4735]|uniref:Lipoprotein n=2 Tax=Streptomyces chrestomyceticus TaxID=68185 RepID=A0A7U9KVJ5_9ACTN|nr:hypothetical protein [Streptomyces chrestomyceticus]GCD35533.1 lipoprotein [Streptomyces chrestomyceticus JCM 4735]